MIREEETKSALFKIKRSFPAQISTEIKILPSSFLLFKLNLWRRSFPINTTPRLFFCRWNFDVSDRAQISSI